MAAQEVGQKSITTYTMSSFTTRAYGALTQCLLLVGLSPSFDRLLTIFFLIEMFRTTFRPPYQIFNEVKAIFF